MKLRRFCIGASIAIGLMAAAPVYAGTPGFCPQVASGRYTFNWWLSAHLPIQALEALFGLDGVCSRN